MHTFVLLALCVLLGFVKAFPLNTSFADCDIHQTKFPQGSTLTPPGADRKLTAIVVGSGAQNYSCVAPKEGGESGTYTSDGAVAKLHDASCLYGSSGHHKGVVKDSGRKPRLLGNHYFIQYNTGILPKFDFTTPGAKTNPATYIVANKTANAPSPDGTTNVDWLKLSKVEGSFAEDVFRVYTLNGKAPASCKVGSDPIAVPYKATYWFYAKA